MCRLLGTTAVLTLAPQAHAAEADTNPDEIIVNGRRVDAYTPKTSSTGAKTDVPLRDIPAAVVIVPAEVLRDQGAQTMDEALTNASAVSPSFGGGYGLADNYVIRGLAMDHMRVNKHEANLLALWRDVAANAQGSVAEASQRLIDEDTVVDVLATLRAAGKTLRAAGSRLTSALDDKMK